MALNHKANTMPDDSGSGAMETEQSAKHSGKFRQPNKTNLGVSQRLACFATVATSLLLPSDRAMADGNSAIPTFGDEVAFLQQHVDLVLLRDASGQAQVAVVPEFQGRVMTSTAAGPDGLSFGWTNHELIASGQRQTHINVFGGEDRFWLGPEGGQYSIFFRPHSPFDLEHWQTPEPIDWGAWNVVRRTDTAVVFQKEMELSNYSAAHFQLRVDREIRLLSQKQIATALGMPLGDRVSVVGYESDNRVTNLGQQAWNKQTGLLSIWILGMFHPSPQTTVVAPFRTDAAGGSGPIVNDAYFGKVPADRLQIDAQQGILFFRADGQHRCKIGISPQRAKNVLGSYDARSGVLTLVQFTLPAGKADYVNSMWELQDAPYAGDVANSYNDGPAEPGAKPFGPFYELETSSPALALGPAQSAGHRQRTIHLQGPEKQLDVVSRRQLGVGLDTIKRAFP